MKVSYSACRVSVVGCEFVCPLCKATVQSGETHSCFRREDGVTGSKTTKALDPYAPESTSQSTSHKKKRRVESGAK